MTKIIIIDDEELILERLSEFFINNTNFEVETYSQGNDFLSNFKEDKDPKIILIDLNLQKQKLSGSDLCKEVKKLKPYIPIFAITQSKDTNYVVNEILSSGFDSFISKDQFKDGFDFNIISKSYEKLINNKDIIEIWDKIISLEKEKNIVFKGMNDDLINSICDNIKKSYFYILLPENLPLLDCILGKKSTSSAESILQSFSCIDELVNKHNREWYEKKLSKSDYTKMFSSIENKNFIDKLKFLFPESGKELLKTIETEIYPLRNISAHRAYKDKDKINKLNAIKSLKTTISFIRKYSDFVEIKKG
jgi:CheY-like chemotaxis protein